MIRKWVDQTKEEFTGTDLLIRSTDGRFEITIGFQGSFKLWDNSKLESFANFEEIEDAKWKADGILQSDQEKDTAESVLMLQNAIEAIMSGAARPKPKRQGTVATITRVLSYCILEKTVKPNEAAF